ncbi:MAG: peptidase M16 domain-containing protein [Bacteroidetes bacterium]|nr:MAG: peptidase M16 domain-containing protein [Bacteroidota bacterium]
MKKIIRSLLVLSLAATLPFACKPKQQTTTTSDPNAFTPQPVTEPVVQTKTYTYDSVPGDPLKARIYKLDNGLKVYMAVYKDAPRIQSYVAVRAGSKNDPAHATGLAHYLEHMLFKGTDVFGSKDFAKEKPYLDKIEALYETYRQTRDEGKRKTLYHEIDSISGVAAQFAIANEYDKMMAAMGGQGTNAHTWVEETVYEEDIPTNMLEKWVILQAERFRKPQMRLFHTELEAVYEEKNRGLDNDGNKAFEALMAGLFPKHQYGQQTTIGTIEHLKNPSITEINKYFYTYYVPNNMAITMAGDFNPDEAIRLIDKHFGKYQRKEVPKFEVAQEAPILAPVEKHVYGPEAESIGMAFRFPGVGTRDADLMQITDKLLSNGKAGLFDLNLNQAQKVLGSYTYPMPMADYSVHIMGADVKEGQKLTGARDLLLGEIEKLKKGEFPDWLLQAVITDMKYQQTKSYESRSSRAYEYVNAFILGVPYGDYVKRIDRMAQYTKQDVMDFVRRNYTNNYVIVYKHTGEDKNVEKVVKPAITPVEVNRDAQSPFLAELANKPSAEIQPVFLDYKKDITTNTLNAGIPFLFSPNTENNTFDMYYVFDMGTSTNKKLGMAVDYLPYLGTSKYSPKQVQEEFYKLGCSYGVFSSDDQVWVSLSGLSENYIKAIQLFEHLLADAQPNKLALKNLVDDQLKMRKDNKQNKNVIRSRMQSYGTFGPANPSTNILSEQELRAVKADELINIIKGLTSFEHRILLYGNVSVKTAGMTLNAEHKVPAQLKPVPAAKQYTRQETGNTVYVVDYDMKQAEIVMISKGGYYTPSLSPQIKMFNEYFGGGMGSVVFQELRESKALAYSTYAYYSVPRKKEDPHYIISYIGTQADKLPEAMKGMTELLTTMPESEVLFGAAKASVVQSLRSDRITKSNILFSYENARKLGLDHDSRKEQFEQIPGMSIADMRNFQQMYVKGKPYTVLVLGKKDQLDINTLKQYGQVKFLTLKDIFGY